MDNDNFDWLRFMVVYTASRLGLLILLVLFGAFSGAVLFPSVATFLPYSLIDVKMFITNSNFESVLGTLVVCLLLIWVFYDDARKHTAYEEWSFVTILTVLLLVGMFYFIPAIFRDSFSAEGKGEIFYMILYYPARWTVELCSGNFLTGVMLSIIVMLGTAMGAYVISYKIYIKKHPVLLKSNKMMLSQTAAEFEDGTSEDENV